MKTERENVGDQIESLEGMLHKSISHVSNFLLNQVDVSKIKQAAIQKVYKQELIEKQEQENQHKLKQQTLSRKNSHSTPESLSLKNNNKKSLKSVGFDLVKAL